MPLLPCSLSAESDVDYVIMSGSQSFMTINPTIQYCLAARFIITQPGSNSYIHQRLPEDDQLFDCVRRGEDAGRHLQ